jgi:hypothetical protein
MSNSIEHLNEYRNDINVIVVYKLNEYKYLVSDVYPGDDCTREELDMNLRHVKWVNLHPVCYVSEIRNSDVTTVEDVVIEYMARYGENSTRATVAPYNHTIFTEEQLKEIRQKIEKYNASQLPKPRSVAIPCSAVTNKNPWKTVSTPRSYLNPALYQHSD